VPLIGQKTRIATLTLCIATSSTLLLAQVNQRQEALALEKQGKSAEAEALWEALSKKFPSNPEPLAHLGLLEARQEHYPAAIRYYRKALSLAPSVPSLQLNLGLALFKNGDYAAANAIFEPMLASQPDDQRLTLLIGMSHYGLHQYSKATTYLKKAADQDPQNLTLLLTLAHSCLLSNQYPCVQEAFHRIVAMNAESAEADMLVGEALDQMKDKDGAIREFRAAVAVNPKEPNVHFGLGYLLWTQEAYPEAAEEFAAERRNDPTHTLAQLYQADAYVQMGKMEEARPLLESLVKTEPQNSKAHLDLGIVYAETEHDQEAIREFQDAARLAPDDSNAHWRLGRLYRKMGLVDKAKEEFAKTANLNKAADDRLLQIMTTLVPQKEPSHSQ